MPDVRLVESNDAQVLPRVGDQRATVSGHFARLACDADMRTKYPEYRALADRLLAVRRG